MEIMHTDVRVKSYSKFKPIPFSPEFGVQTIVLNNIHSKRSDSPLFKRKVREKLVKIPLQQTLAILLACSKNFKNKRRKKNKHTELYHSNHSN